MLEPAVGAEVGPCSVSAGWRRRWSWGVCRCVSERFSRGCHCGCCSERGRRGSPVRLNVQMVQRPGNGEEGAV